MKNRQTKKREDSKKAKKTGTALRVQRKTESKEKKSSIKVKNSGRKDDKKIQPIQVSSRGKTLMRAQSHSNDKLISTKKISSSKGHEEKETKVSESKKLTQKKVQILSSQGSKTTSQTKISGKLSQKSESNEEAQEHSTDLAPTESESLMDTKEEIYITWQKYKKKYGSMVAENYDKDKGFRPRTPINHPIWGWGFITGIENDRLHVIFKEGIKILISNYRKNVIDDIFKE